jgi:hypothetical protein
MIHVTDGKLSIGSVRYTIHEHQDLFYHIRNQSGTIVLKASAVQFHIRIRIRVKSAHQCSVLSAQCSVLLRHKALNFQHSTHSPRNPPPTTRVTHPHSASARPAPAPPPPQWHNEARPGVNVCVFGLRLRMPRAPPRAPPRAVGAPRRPSPPPPPHPTIVRARILLGFSNPLAAASRILQTRPRSTLSTGTLLLHTNRRSFSRC